MYSGYFLAMRNVKNIEVKDIATRVYTYIL